MASIPLHGRAQDAFACRLWMDMTMVLWPPQLPSAARLGITNVLVARTWPERLTGSPVRLRKFQSGKRYSQHFCQAMVGEHVCIKSTPSLMASAASLELSVVVQVPTEMHNPQRAHSLKMCRPVCPL